MISVSSGPNSLSEIDSVMAIGPRDGRGEGSSSGAGVDSRAEARMEGLFMDVGTRRARRFEVSGSWVAGGEVRFWGLVVGFLGFAGPRVRCFLAGGLDMVWDAGSDAGSDAGWDVDLDAGSVAVPGGRSWGSIGMGGGGMH